MIKGRGLAFAFASGWAVGRAAVRGSSGRVVERRIGAGVVRYAVMAVIVIVMVLRSWVMRILILVFEKREGKVVWQRRPRDAVARKRVID